jgi:hypothetical protein
MENRTSIHLNPDSIQIEVVRNGQRSIKNTNVQAIQEVLTRGERIETPLLPYGWGVQKYTKVNNMEQYVIATPETRHVAKFDMYSETGERGDNRFPEFQIVAPAALWIIHVQHNPANDTRRYRHGVAYALKQPVLSLNDQLYTFPFANSNHSYLCWGSESDYPALGGSKSIMTVPDRFFANPFNNDLDGGKFERFEEEVNGQRVYRERTLQLLQHMDKVCKEADAKGETPRFRNEILIQAGRLGDLIQSHGQQYLR